MTQLNNETMQKGLKQLGIKEGDVVLVHSDLLRLGIPEQARNRESILNFYLRAFQNVLGEKGTIAVPAYFYEYARYGIPFDTELSPVSKSLGAFSAHICTLPGKVRSTNPLQSIAALGPHAEFIAGSNSLSGYGVNSPWHRLRMLNAKLVFIGIGMETMTYVHHLEQEVGVPHLYFKVYPYPITRGGNPIPGNPVSAVRYLNYGIEYDLKPFESHLLRTGLARSVAVGKGNILSVSAEDAYQAGIKYLGNNIYAFLKAPPQFIAGQIPCDGIPK
ncbi:AAC(3) family N-acetyltransferase [Parachlamydia sp. AcF125]|uniref:AAC(3) family N-acetyltransferase n=1 Tax=Parachlamydia sp. AcF125 TaxID=2795736 RepID=UPI001BC8DBF1|nr:AAC(3) family N-acetyltransferase [Parachlamydia sp. AcF125]MBS4169085.1 SPBc2 prophage-derived aminoglycoside N(3')-acetyltransferase-like protein YokD [Parachlamydia sp. AcF125]